MLSALHGLIGIAHAQNLGPPATVECTGPFGIFITGGYGAPGGTGFTCFAQYVTNLTFIVITGAASLCLVMLMVNGFRYMYGSAIPGGSSDAAKKGIGASLAGLALALLTYVILDTFISAVTQ